jgi:outer membrane PBP1 activator LpoA protein
VKISDDEVEQVAAEMFEQSMRSNPVTAAYGRWGELYSEEARESWRNAARERIAASTQGNTE